MRPPPDTPESAFRAHVAGIVARGEHRRPMRARRHDGLVAAAWVVAGWGVVGLAAWAWARPW